MSATVSSDVRERRDEVRAPALVDAQQRVGDLEVRERPQPEDAEAHDPRVLEAEEQPAQGPRRGDRDQAGDGRDREHRRDRRRRQAVALVALLGGVVVAHERLAEAEAQQDRHEDDERQQRLGDPEVRLRQRARVERQRHEREHSRRDARRLVRRAAGEQAREEAAHEAPRYCPGVPEPQPCALLLLPRPLEGFILEDQARDLLRAPGVVAADPPRVRYGAIARLPAALRDTLARGTARRLLRALGGELRAVVIFHPVQWPLAQALLALQPERRALVRALGSLRGRLRRRAEDARAAEPRCTRRPRRAPR